MKQRWTNGRIWLVVGLVAAAYPARTQQPAMVQQGPLSPQQLVQAMVNNEDDEEAHRDQYQFLSQERSDRTGGHMWTERVVETAHGRMRRLIAEDGKPLAPDRAQKERARLDAIAANPNTFLHEEQIQLSDEAHARQMLDMLPKAFIFDNVRLAEGVWRMDFHPNPDYTPPSLQARVLHGMSGWVAIDAKALRLLHIEAQLPKDESIGFGLLATIKTGSRVMTDRRDVNSHWRTTHVLTDVRGKAAFFKSVSRNSEVWRSDFTYLDHGASVAESVAMLEKDPE